MKNMNGPIRRRSLCPQKTPTSNVLFRGVSGNHLTSKGGHTADTRGTGRLFFSFAGYTGSTLPPFMFSHVQSMRRRRDDFCSRAVASSYTGSVSCGGFTLAPVCRVQVATTRDKFVNKVVTGRPQSIPAAREHGSPRSGALIGRTTTTSWPRMRKPLCGLHRTTRIWITW